MNALAWMVPLALGMGFIGLMAFLWSLKSGQLDDLEGAAIRVLLDKEDRPLTPPRGLVKKQTERQLDESLAKEESDGKHY